MKVKTIIFCAIASIPLWYFIYIIVKTVSAMFEKLASAYTF